MSIQDLAAYPDHTKCFDIFTEASDYQLGACIMHHNINSMKNVYSMYCNFINIYSFFNFFQIYVFRITKIQAISK